MLFRSVWAAPTHTYQGANWVNVIYVPLMTVGTLLTMFGFGLLAYAIWKAAEFEPVVQEGLPADA